MKRIIISVIAFCLLLAAFVCRAENADSANLILNGSFEDGGDMPYGWTSDCYITDGVRIETAINEADNSSCLHVITDTDNDARIVQEIEVGENTYVKISCLIRADVKSGDGACISIIDYPEARSSYVSSSRWTIAEFYCYTAEISSVKVALRLGYYGNLGSGEAWFDDVRVEILDAKPASCISLYPIETQQNTQEEQSQPAYTGETGQMPYLYQIITTLVITAAFALIAWLIMRFCRKEPAFTEKSSGTLLFWILLIIGLILRIIANFTFKSRNGTYGHSTDIGCFSAWSSQMTSAGPAGFYAPGYFADYPPGYMWILGACDLIRKLFNVGYGTAAQSLILKMPSIICDLVCAALIYSIAIKSGRTQPTALFFAAMIIFNPLVIFISAVWGQIDIMLTLFVCLGFIYFLQGRNEKSYKPMILSGVTYGIAVAFKPQALMLGPLYAAVFVIWIISFISKKQSIKHAILKTLTAAACAFAVIIIPAIPFVASQPLLLIEKYAGTASSYNYATVEAYNLFGLLGANWKDADAAFIGALTYKQFGTIAMCVTVAASIALYFFESRKHDGAIFLSAALLIAGIFTFGHFMHERYLFPAVIFLLFAAVKYNDRRLYIAFALTTLSMLYNAAGAFLIVDCRMLSIDAGDYQSFVRIGSLMTLAAFVYLVVTICLILFGKKPDKYNCFPTSESKGEMKKA